MFLDSNIFINASLDRLKDGASCRALLERVAKGEQKASTSPLVLDEMLYVLSDLRGQEFAIKRYESFISMPNLDLLAVDKKAAQTVPEFFKSGLEPRDAMHAATMKANSIETICSYDRAFDKIKGIKRQEPK